MGLPGENKYGAVRFFKKVGNGLVEAVELFLDAREVFVTVLGRQVKGHN